MNSKIEPTSMKVPNVVIVTVLQGINAANIFIERKNEDGNNIKRELLIWLGGVRTHKGRQIGRTLDNN